MSTTETIRAWSTTNAGNAASDAAIASSDSQAPSTLDDNIRSIMVAARKQMDDIGGKLVAGGTANALTVTTGQVLESGQITDGLRILLRATAANTLTTVTFAPDGLTAANIKRADGSVLAVGSIQSGMYLDLVYNSGASEWRAANIAPLQALASITSTATVSNAGTSVFTGFLFGLTLSNDSGGTTAIAIAAGSARDSTDVDMLTLASALTGKVLANAWTVGNGGGLLDTGVIGNQTWHIFLIKRTDTGVVDVLASGSPTTPAMPANYTLFRRIGSIVRSAGAIKLFQQDGDRFRWLVAVADISASNPGTAAVTRLLTVPTGIVVWADVAVQLDNTSTAYIAGLLTSLDETNTVPAFAGSFNFGSGLASTAATTTILVKTNTSAQIRSRLSASGGSDVLHIATFGWIDQRGKLY